MSFGYKIENFTLSGLKVESRRDGITLGHNSNNLKNPKGVI